MSVLKEQQKAMHVKDILPLVVEHRPETTRGSIESALVRGMESVKYKGLIKRTAPSTFAVQVS